MAHFSSSFFLHLAMSWLPSLWNQILDSSPENGVSEGGEGRWEGGWDGVRGRGVGLEGERDGRAVEGMGEGGRREREKDGEGEGEKG